MFQLPYTQEKAQSKIREEFLKNSHVRDVRAIDMLVIKSQMIFKKLCSSGNKHVT